MDYMHSALNLAWEALGSTSPNPAVGAVVVRDGKIIGRGATQPPGHPHAEVVALREAGDLAHGASMYVTLEPCCHYGRTSPCTEALVAAGIGDVTVGLLDPNRVVNGQGVAALQAAGIPVTVGVKESDARDIVEGYIHYVETGRAMVVAKFAMSLDGKIATATGESRWISGVSSRQRAQELRRISDAVVVGIGTALLDDPRLTARNPSGEPRSRQPLRVIIDSTGRLPAHAQLLKESGPIMLVGATLQPHNVKRLEKIGVEVVELPNRRGQVDLQALVTYLSNKGILRILVEGGGTLMGSLFDGQIIDKVEAFVAPIMLGGAGSPTPIAGSGVSSISNRVLLDRMKQRTLDEDIHITGYPIYGSH